MGFVGVWVEFEEAVIFGWTGLLTGWRSCFSGLRPGSESRW